MRINIDELTGLENAKKLLDGEDYEVCIDGAKLALVRELILEGAKRASYVELGGEIVAKYGRLMRSDKPIERSDLPQPATFCELARELAVLLAKSEMGDREHYRREARLTLQVFSNNYPSAFRDARGRATQTYIAGLADIGQGTVSQLERGRIGRCNMLEALKLVSYYASA